MPAFLHIWLLGRLARKVYCVSPKCVIYKSGFDFNTDFYYVAGPLPSFSLENVPLSHHIPRKKLSLANFIKAYLFLKS